MTDLLESDVCKQHFQTTTAFDIKTNTSVCNAWMVQMDNLDNIVFSGMIWGSVKKRLNKSYDRYEKAATKCNEIYQKKIRQSCEDDVNMQFAEIKRMIEEWEKVIKQKAETSKNYQELKIVFENAPELSSSTISHIEQEKKKFDEKMDTKKFGYVTRRKEFYEKIIGEVTLNTSRLEDLHVHGSKKAKSIMKLNSDQQFISNKFTELTNDIFEVDGSRIFEQQKIMQPVIDREKFSQPSQIKPQTQQINIVSNIPPINLNVNQARSITPSQIFNLNKTQINQTQNNQNQNNQNQINQNQINQNQINQTQVNQAQANQANAINVQKPQIQPSLNIQRVLPQNIQQQNAHIQNVQNQTIQSQVSQNIVQNQSREENKTEIQTNPRLMINLNQTQGFQMRANPQVPNIPKFVHPSQPPVVDQARAGQGFRPPTIPQLIRKPVPVAAQQAVSIQQVNAPQQNAVPQQVTVPQQATVPQQMPVSQQMVAQVQMPKPLVQEEKPQAVVIDITEAAKPAIQQVEEVKKVDEEAKTEFSWPKVLHPFFYKNRGQDVFRLDINGLIIKPQCFRAENLCMYRLVYTSDQKLYIIGGCNNDEFSHVYSRTRKIDIKKRNSLIVAQMTTPRANFGVCLSDDESKIFVAGGDISFDETTDEVEMYDAQADKWTTLPKLNQKKSMVSLFCHNDQLLYCFGGYDKQNSSSPFYDTIERLSLKDESQKWEILEAKLPYKVSSVGCIPLNSTEVLVIGGWNGTSNKKISSIQIKTSETGSQSIKVEEKGELSQGDHFEQNNIFAKSAEEKLAIAGHFGVHLLNISTLKFDFTRYH